MTTQKATTDPTTLTDPETCYFGCGRFMEVGDLIQCVETGVLICDVCAYENTCEGCGDVATETYEEDRYGFGTCRECRGVDRRVLMG